MYIFYILNAFSQLKKNAKGAFFSTVLTNKLFFKFFLLN